MPTDKPEGYPPEVLADLANRREALRVAMGADLDAYRRLVKGEPAVPQTPSLALPLVAVVVSALAVGFNFGFLLRGLLP